MVDAGCVFEERQGWERPGWFSPKGPAPVPQYDWYGSYGTPRNSDVRYENMLKADHTFGFSKSHQIVSIQLFVVSGVPLDMVIVFLLCMAMWAVA